MAAAAFAAVAAGAAVLFGPPERKERSLPHPALVAAALVLVFSLQAVSMRSFYDGGQGDNRYQLAIVRQVLSGRLLGDYYYEGVPAHYPPLFFWMAGGFGKLAGLDAETTLRWMPVLALVLAAAGIALLARGIGASPSLAIVTSFAIGGFATYYLFSYPPDRGLWMILIEKPQQLLGGILCLGLPVAISNLRARPAALSIAVAILGAALALTMPIFVPIALAASLFVAISAGDAEGRARRVAALLVGAAGAVLLASPYLWPVARGLAAGRRAGGYIYWQSLASLDVSHWTVGFGFGIPLVLAALSVKAILKQEDPGQRYAALALGSVTVIAWAVYFSAFLTYPLFGWSLFSWWATVPAVLGTCLVASWGITNRIRSYITTPRLGHRFSKEAITRTCVAVVVAMFAASWSARTDDFLGYSHSPVDPAFRRAAVLLEEMTPEGSSFVGGQEELMISALSGRGLVYVAHAFYASPLADSTRRREDVVDLLHRPSCEKVYEMQRNYGMEAVALSPAARWIPKILASSSISVEEDAPALEPDDLVMSDLVAERRGDPERVSRTVLYRASPELRTLRCLQEVDSSPALVLFVVRPSA